MRCRLLCLLNNLSTSRPFNTESRLLQQHSTAVQNTLRCCILNIMDVNWIVDQERHTTRYNSINETINQIKLCIESIDMPYNKVQYIMLDTAVKTKDMIEVRVFQDTTCKTGEVIITKITTAGSSNRLFNYYYALHEIDRLIGQAQLRA